MQFDFGKNWAEFSEHALTDDRVAQARHEFIQLLEGIPVNGRSFLDIGFGQGLSLLTAASLGAYAVGCDINPRCRKVLEQNKRFFPQLGSRDLPVVIGSILDRETTRTIQATPGVPADGFDIVHSWGVLHHTGDMKRAIEIAASLVRHDGHLIVALYNRHWSSAMWLGVKWLYCKSPTLLQKILVRAFVPIIWLAKLVVTGGNPRHQQRGMHFYYNVVDWVGGYPYEYASIREIEALCDPLGFKLVRVNPANVPTGCNEFVFRREPAR
jgi:2-polyprenyl-6-hydroxyphenyl methylase/3-demethylubiquinone-9 3-methyltransferase